LDNEGIATSTGEAQKAAVKPAVKPKPLSKKERQALKAKELDDLDSLLNEFGVEEAPQIANEEDKAEEDSAAAEAAASSKKKKKKKGKKKIR